MQAVAAAWSLATVAVWYHNVLPLCGAAPIAVFGLFGPLRLGSLILSRALQRFLLRLLLRALAFAAAAFVISFAVNSELATVSAIGSVLFLALLAVLAFEVFRMGKDASSRLLSVAWPMSGSALDYVRTSFGWLSLSLQKRPNRQE